MAVLAHSLALFFPLLFVVLFSNLQFLQQVALAHPQPLTPLIWTGWGWVPSGVLMPMVGPPMPVYGPPVLPHGLLVQMYGMLLPPYLSSVLTHGTPMHGMPTYRMPMHGTPALTSVPMHGLLASTCQPPTPSVPTYRLPVSSAPTHRSSSPGSASTLWAGASSQDIAREVHMRHHANCIRNLPCGLWPVLDDEVVSISLPLPNIYLDLDYLGRLDELEATWKHQGLCLSGYEDHVLDAHRLTMQLTQVVSLDYEGLVSIGGVKSRFCLVLSSRQHIRALGTMVAMHGVIVSTRESEVHSGMEGTLMALSLLFLVGCAWESSNNLFTFYLCIRFLLLVYPFELCLTYDPRYLTTQDGKSGDISGLLLSLLYFNQSLSFFTKDM